MFARPHVCVCVCTCVHVCVVLACRNPTATQQPRRPLPSTHTTLHSNTHTATGPTHTHTHSQRPNSAHSPHTQPSPTSKATHSAHTAWPHSSSSSHSHKSSHKGDSDSSKVNTTGWLYSFVRLVRVEPLDTHDRLAVAARSTSARPAAGTGRVGSIHALTPPHLIPQTTDVSSTTTSAHLPHTQQATHTGSTAQRVSTVSSVEHVHSSTVRSSGNTSSTQRSTGPGQVPGVRGSAGVRTGLEAYSHWHKQKRLGGVREWDTCVRVAGTQGQQQQQRPGSAPGVGHRWVTWLHTHTHTHTHMHTQAQPSGHTGVWNRVCEPDVHAFAAACCLCVQASEEWDVPCQPWRLHQHQRCQC